MQIRISFLVNDANKKNTYINQSEHFRPKKKKKIYNISIRNTI